jgi:uncharacterized DUF497 family protein
MIAFEWDLEKSGANLKKHGVSFEETQPGFSLSVTVSVTRGT